MPVNSVTTPANSPVAASTADGCRVLKADAVRIRSSRASEPDQRLHDSCDGYLDEVRQQARQILAEAHLEAEAIRRRAYEQGELDGQDAGRDQRDCELQARALELARQMARHDFAPAVAAWHAAAGSVLAAREHWLARWETDAVRLSVAIAEKLIRNELRHRPELVAETVRELLQLAAGSSDVSVRLHPLDLELIQQHRADDSSGFASTVAVRWVPDERLARGDCVVETRQGEIDARLETQLARIANEFA
jgi:flagellar biosynthesis/type III secretory pathway protein FliH